jgi:hypothetical protein
MKPFDDFQPTRTEMLTPREFLNLPPEKRANIAHSEIVIQGKRSSKHLAKFRVIYKRPIYKAST